MRHSPDLKKLAAFAAIYLIWGSTYLAIQYGITSLPPFLMAGFRFLIAGIPLVLIARWRGAAAPTRKQWGSATLIGGLLLFGGNGLVTWGQQWVPSGLAAVLIATVPLWMVVIDRAFYCGPRITLPMILGLLSGIGGVVILVGGGRYEANTVHPIGGMLVLLAALSWSVGSLHSRRVDLPDSPILTAGMEMMMGGLVMIAVGSVSGEWVKLEWSAISGTAVIAFLYLVVFGSIIALSAYAYLLRAASPAAVSTYAFVNPVVAIFLGWAVAGEQVGSRVILASALIIGAVVAIQLSRRQGSSTPVGKPELAPILPEILDPECPQEPVVVRATR